MLSTILLPVGTSDSARVDDLVSHAIDVAEPAGATVVVAHVVGADEHDVDGQNYPYAVAQIGFDVQSRDLPAEKIAEDLEPIGEIVDRLEEAGVDVEIRAAVGNPESEILRIAEETGADNIVVGGRKRSPAGKAVFGSTAQKIMLNAPCPVTYVRDRS
ncbi:universal stress protein [Natronococcus sp. A-GB1]|uniref:universal stress protein n=1 Tax=Natronococcus sp. A-GB1 TaxID=3037648 RepID=UPI00241F76D5|nr:universal stress protein [Natronococcus sp. A-GB1]MDG5761425.1 universal stress protein [Natronococcus sp. A-GB1]